MPVAAQGGDSHSAEKGPPPLSATAGRRKFSFFHQGNRLLIYGIGDVALEIYFAKLSWHYSLLPYILIISKCRPQLYFS